MQTSNPLGQTTIYPDAYDAGLLFPINRQVARNGLGLTGALPFRGVDRWTAYELSWLDVSGKPVMALAEFTFPADSPFIVESKSLKLYLNSFNQTCFETHQCVETRIARDLSAAVGAPVDIHLMGMAESCAHLAVTPCVGECLDNLPLSVSVYQPDPGLLSVNTSVTVSHTLVYSHLLKTNCPVTNQPDWATVLIEYSGRQIRPESLLAYIISFRHHQDFHENCVERLFCDIKQQCQPDNLTVYARYTRRGGLDINPLRSDYALNASLLDANTLRGVRQ